MKHLIALIVLSLSCNLILAQDNKEVREAHKLFKNEQYAEALPLYKKFLTINPTNKDYAYKFGACRVMLNQNNKEALEYLLKLEKEGVEDEKIAYFIGRAYENEKNYEKAKIYYKRFKEVADRKQIRRLKVRKRIRTCRRALR